MIAANPASEGVDRRINLRCANTRLRRASAIATLSLLASAATANAECAWVLWEHVTGVMGGKAIDFYTARMADARRIGLVLALGLTLVTLDAAA